MLPVRFLNTVIRLLKPIGITLNPFKVVEEGQQASALPTPAANVQYSIADVDRIPELLTLLSPHTTASLEQRFAEGKLCFVAEVDSRIGAIMWADTKAFNYPPNFFPLAQGEAYLFAAFADRQLRGLNLTPALRQFCYDTLRQQGVHTFYSYTDLTNTAARRFKAKLNARETQLRVYIAFGQIWSRTFTLRKYL